MGYVNGSRAGVTRNPAGGGFVDSRKQQGCGWIYLDQPANIREAVVSIVPRVKSYLWLMTVVAFRAWAPLAALYVAMFAVLFSVLPKGFFTNPAIAQSPVPRIHPHSWLRVLAC